MANISCIFKTDVIKCGDTVFRHTACATYTRNVLICTNEEIIRMSGNWRNSIAFARSDKLWWQHHWQCHWHQDINYYTSNRCSSNNYFRLVPNIHQTKSATTQVPVPDKVRHTGVWVINSTEARQYGHYCNPNDSDSTNTLLNGQNAYRTHTRKHISLTATKLAGPWFWRAQTTACYCCQPEKSFMVLTKDTAL